MGTERQQPLVLLVDDAPAIRDGLALLLGRRGFRVVTAADAETALCTVKERPHKLAAIVTDLVMGPGLDGVALADEARHMGFNGPIVLVSGEPLDVLRKRSEGTSVDRVLTKPATNELVEVLDAVVEKSALESPAPESQRSFFLKSRTSTAEFLESKNG